MTDVAVPSRLDALIWPALERRHPHVHLGALAAFFELCEARYDRPMQYHTPPPLAPMVHCARVPAELALRELSAFTRSHSLTAPSDVAASEVPVAGLRAYLDMVQTPDDDEAVLVGLVLLRKLASTEAGGAAVASGAVLTTVSALGMRLATPQLASIAGAVCELLRTVASASTAGRDLVLESQGVEAIAAIALRFIDDLPTLRAATSTVPVVIRTDRVPVEARFLRPLVDALPSLLRHPDDDVRIDAVAMLGSITDGPQLRIELGLPLLPDVMPFLKLTDEKYVSPALRVVGNVATGNDSQTDALISAGALAHFPALVVHSSPAVRKEVCWTISNICAGSSSQIQAVIDAGLLRLMLNILRQGTDTEGVVKEAVWVIANVATTGLREQIKLVATTDALEAVLHRLMATRDVRMQQALLETLESCFLADSAHIDAFRAINGSVAQLRELRNSAGNFISNVVESFLDNYFADDDNNEAGH